MRAFPLQMVRKVRRVRLKAVAPAICIKINSACQKEENGPATEQRKDPIISESITENRELVRVAPL